MANVPHFIVDDFLPPDVHDGLLSRTLNLRDFTPGKVVSNGQVSHLPDHRRGQLSNDRLGPYLPAFRSALRSKFSEIYTAIGMAAFDIAEIEIRLVAHTDGDFFKVHSDTMTGGNGNTGSRDRLISAVYYFHRQPKIFEGGELQIFPFDGSAPTRIEPRDNRLVAFPAFLLHEVLPVSLPDGDFADSRFSVSCWFHRDRPGISDVVADPEAGCAN
jgi:SM-20-related protein